MYAYGLTGISPVPDLQVRCEFCRVSEENPAIAMLAMPLRSKGRKAIQCLNA